MCAWGEEGAAATDKEGKVTRSIAPSSPGHPSALPADETLAKTSCAVDDLVYQAGPSLTLQRVWLDRLQMTP